MMKRLFYKEWRENRVVPLWLALLLPLAMIAFKRFDRPQPPDTVIFLYGSWILAGLFAGCGLIAREVGNGTLAFLMSMPVTRRRVWSLKVAAGLVVLLLAIITTSVVWTVTQWLLFQSLIMLAFNHQIMLAFDHGTMQALASAPWLVLAAVGAFSLSLLISTLLDRAISTAMVAMAAGVAVLIPIGYFTDSYHLVFGRDDVFGLIVMVGLCIPAVLVAAYWSFTRGESLRTRRRYYWALGPGLLVLVLTWTLAMGIHSRLTRLQEAGNIIPHAALSPDGRLAAVHVLSDGPSYTLHPVRVSDLEDNLNSYCRGDHLVLQDLDMGAIRQVLPGGNMVCWSPDGRMLAYQQNVGDLGIRRSRGTGVVVDIRTGQQYALPVHENYRYLSGLSWSPDGHWLVVQHGRWSGIVTDREVEFIDRSHLLTGGGALLPSWSFPVDQSSSVGYATIARAANGCVGGVTQLQGWSHDSRFFYLVNRRGLLAVDIGAWRRSKYGTGVANAPGHSIYGIVPGISFQVCDFSARGNRLVLTDNDRRALVSTFDDFPEDADRRYPPYAVNWNSTPAVNYVLDLAAATKSALLRDPAADPPTLEDAVRQFPGSPVIHRAVHGIIHISPDARYLLLWGHRASSGDDTLASLLDIDSGASMAVRPECTGDPRTIVWLGAKPQFYLRHSAGAWQRVELPTGHTRPVPSGLAPVATLTGISAGVRPDGRLVLCPATDARIDHLVEQVR